MLRETTTVNQHDVRTAYQYVTFHALRWLRSFPRLISLCFARVFVVLLLTKVIRSDFVAVAMAAAEKETDPFEKFDFDDNLKEFFAKNKLNMKIAEAFDELGIDSLDCLQRFTSIEAVEKRFQPPLKPGHCDRLFVCICR